ncbi:RNA polymerase sigma factor [Curtobacterium sp. MCPF17_052]|uniref:RNA polymerase sigma factor n=1 Tax=Curtobacterium sp. MCPF17_052 TaxID=2175655 RepID=UPI0024DFB4C6|nr:RNA polymerase sigma factor [Curtobacterium sp. MCPF17_052]WIB13667.1 RNA polymerase sigma factor [Curtobacterium sp. MCPF17_052]
MDALIHDRRAEAALDHIATHPHTTLERWPTHSRPSGDEDGTPPTPIGQHQSCPATIPPPDAAAELGRQFDLHGRRILRYLARRTDLQSAEDILSETFVTALVRWGSFDPERQEPLPWLFGIATNLLSRHWRSQRRTLRAMSRSATPEHVEDETGDRVDVQRAVQAVVRELDRMRPAVRDTVLLYAWAELTYEQIAAATGVPVGTVRSRLNRARTALRAVPGATDSLNGPLHV